MATKDKYLHRWTCEGYFGEQCVIDVEIGTSQDVVELLLRGKPGEWRLSTLKKAGKIRVKGGKKRS